jgi:formylglycine-generating enzyme required for sulfatase activity
VFLRGSHCYFKSALRRTFLFIRQNSKILNMLKKSLLTYYYLICRFTLIFAALFCYPAGADNIPQDNLSEIEKQLQQASQYLDKDSSPWEKDTDKTTTDSAQKFIEQPIEQPIEKSAQASRPLAVIAPELLQRLNQDMIWVEGGKFTMGTDSDTALKREQPAHPVVVDGFYIGRTELTQDLFEAVMGWNVSYFACDNCPINNISWFNIQLFIERLNKITSKTFRLPTEAEWAYAAKGGNKSKGYLYSGSNNIAEVAWFAGNAEKRSHPVAQKKPNELGLYDMTGNLWEFCIDDMSAKIYQLHVDRHGNEPRVNPMILVKSKNLRRKAMKVQRGSGYEFEAGESEVFRRDAATSNVRMPDIGFRLALSNDKNEVEVNP